MTNCTLLWYRNDLRLHDHEPLSLAAQSPILPLYCFDPRQFATTSFGFAKTGNYRARFLLESVMDLRQSWQHLGGDLVIRCGKPEEIIPNLVQAYGVSSVYFHQEVTAEEIRVETLLKAKLEAIGVAVKPFWGSTLFHPDDLPFGTSQVPELFTHFRKAIEQQCQVRSQVRNSLKTVQPIIQTTTGTVSHFPGLEPGALPSLQDLGVTTAEIDPRAALLFKGGETEAKVRLQSYFWQGDHLREYKQTRNGMLGADYSSKFSPWLALGCLSPRYIYDQVQAYENQRIRNDSTYWLIFELLWRDYFRWICAKHGNKIFHAEGLQGISISWKQDWERFEAWTSGQTGFPLVDANMQELKLTGFMSNRGRQNVASFLTKNLGIDWRMGAEWFESRLIDYDVCSNWGNWNYSAGVGNDARGFRFFNILKQSKDYDPTGEYVKCWLPQLQQVPSHKVHEPWRLLPVEQARFGVTLGVDYPNPIVDFFESAKSNEKIYQAAIGAATNTRSRGANLERRRKSPPKRR